MAETSISMMKTYFIEGISEPFDEPPFRFDKVNKHQESLRSLMCLLVPVIIYHQRIRVFCIYTAFSQALHKSDTYRGNKSLARISCILLHLKCTDLIMNMFHVALDIQAID